MQIQMQLMKTIRLEEDIEKYLSTESQEHQGKLFFPKDHVLNEFDNKSRYLNAKNTRMSVKVNNNMDIMASI